MKGSIATDAFRISSDFECGNGEQFREIKPNHISFQPTQDPGEGYSAGAHYFCVRVQNTTDHAARLLLGVQAVIEPLWDGWSMALESDVLTRRGGDWGRLSKDQFRTTRECISIELMLDGGEVVFLSNMFWYPPSEMTCWLESVVSERPELCRLRSIGKTEEGRDIPLLTIADPAGDDNRQRVMIAATPQANEMGDWACRWVIEELLGGGGPPRDWVGKYVFDVVPQPNPDGKAHGTCMTNALGQNPMFDYDAASSGETRSREATAMWQWMTKNTPALLLEYHNFFQYRRRAKLYVYDPVLYPCGVHREADKVISEAMSAAWEDSDVDFIQADHELFHGILPYKAAEKLGTIAHAYKLHTRYSFERNRDITLRVFRAMMKAYDSVDLP